jgi:zinc protease
VIALLSSLSLAETPDEVAVPAAVPESVAAPAGPDRSGPPSVLPPTLMDLPEPEVHALAPGVEAWYVRAPGVRKVAVHVVLRQGHVELSGVPTQLSRAVGGLADAAAGELTSAELSTERDLNEIELWSTAGLHEVEVGLLVPAEKLARGLQLEALVLREPVFPRREARRWVLDQELYYTVSGPASQQSVAGAALAFAWFPPDHPYGARPDLTELADVKPRHLRDTWTEWLRAAPMTVVVVGDVEWSAVEGPVKGLVDALGRDTTHGVSLEVPPPARSRIVAVDMPGQEQVAIQARLEAPTTESPELPSMIATNFVLGGTFLSRLNRNLREEKGFTYGAGSRYRVDRRWGNLSIAVDVKPENVAETVREIEAELARLVAEPVTAEELDGARRSLAADWNRTFETADRAMGLYRRALSQDRTVAELRAPYAALQDLTPADLQRVSATWFAAERPRVWVVVGPRKTLEPQLAQLGIPVQWTEPDRAILGMLPPLE